MQANNLSILITRPVSESLSNEIKLKGFDIDIISFIQIEKIKTKAVEKQIENVFELNTTIVFTSMNAVEAVAEHLQNKKPNWKIYCIGNTTRLLIEKYFGTELITATADDATALAKKIISKKQTDEVYFFCGDNKRNELPDLLNQNNIDVHTIEVYSTTILQHKTSKDYDGILFFSPTAVNGFFKTNNINATTILFAIGNTTADELKKFTSNKIVVSDKPGKENLVEKVMAYYEKQ